jgi:hypothetical protein
MPNSLPHCSILEVNIQLEIQSTFNRHHFGDDMSPKHHITRGVSRSLTGLSTWRAF